MPFFTEGQDPLDHGANPPGRMPIGQPSVDPFLAPVRQQENQELLGIALGLALIIVLFWFGVWLSRNRKRIAKAGDSMVVTGLARGVLVSRKVQGWRKSFTDRVIAKANEGNAPDQ
jgi:hypothetical protein